MACDLCGKKTYKLGPLHDQYQTEEIQNICYECEKIVDNHLHKIVKMTNKMRASLLKRFIECLKRKKQND